MNSKFTEEQIKAYAAQFREGDAIWCGGKWHEMKILPYSKAISLGVNNPGNLYIVNWGLYKNYRGVSNGFKKNANTLGHQYRVTTLDDYELQGGEKIVWLGDSDDFRTFGRAYETKITESNITYQDKEGELRLITGYLWGIIPRYEQVKNLEKTTITEQVNEAIKNKMNTDRPASSHYHIDNNGNDVWQFADDNLSKERVKGFHQINAIKYVSRYNKKHVTSEKRIEDLEKAKVSIDKLIELERKSMTSKGCDVVEE